MTKLEQIAHVIASLAPTVGQVDDKTLARCIGTMIFDIPMTRSGLVSESLTDKYGYRPSISKCCLEHFHSRQQSGYKIIDMMRGECSFEEIVSFLKTATMAHLTTSEENIRLSKIQNHPATKDLSWQDQYKLAGIKLVEDKGTMPARVKKELGLK